MHKALKYTAIMLESYSFLLYLDYTLIKKHYFFKRKVTPEMNMQQKLNFVGEVFGMHYERDVHRFNNLYVLEKYKLD